jgi:hypothetical protein
LNIYTPRVDSWMASDPSDAWSTQTAYIPEDHIHHHHRQDKSDKTLRRHMDHSYGKYGRVRFSQKPHDEELMASNVEIAKQDGIKTSGRRVPNVFSACHDLD